MPQSIPRGLTRDHVLKALADLDAGVAHDFGEPTKFEVLYKGKRYAPKAVIGLACRHLTGRVWRHTEFSSGTAPGQACYVLQQLGFTVVRKGQPAEGEGRDWSKDEVAHIVTDYFDMLRQELHGQAYNKTDHRNALRPKLWKVCTFTPSRPFLLTLQSNSSWIRLLNITTRMARWGTWCARTRCSTRSTIVVVLPEPATASTLACEFRSCRMMASCSWVSFTAPAPG